VRAQSLAGEKGNLFSSRAVDAPRKTAELRLLCRRMPAWAALKPFTMRVVELEL
jgi:hypothetical protein